VCTRADEAMSVLYLACIHAGSIIDGVSRSRLEKRLFQLVRHMATDATPDQIRDIESRFDQLNEQLGDADTNSLPIHERLHSFLRLSYHAQQEDLSER
jgi:cob(I)alamin adenosyltransferase